MAETHLAMGRQRKHSQKTGTSESDILQQDAAQLPLPARITGAVVAPTTLATALFYYFGWSHAYWFFDYLGVNSTLLGLSTTDYLMRSLDALFVPVTTVACAVLAVAWGHTVLLPRIATYPRLLRILNVVTGISGVFLTLAGLIRVFGVRIALDNYVAASPLAMATGIVLTAYSLHLHRQYLSDQPNAARPRSEWQSAGRWLAGFVLIGLSLFWAANDYSAAVGRARARQFVQEMPTYPNIHLYSAESLSLSIPGIIQTKCADPEATYGYRYDGFKLVLESNGQYLLLPTSWTPANGVAVLLPRNESVRLEFAHAQNGLATSHPHC